MRFSLCCEMNGTEVGDRICCDENYEGMLKIIVQWVRMEGRRSFKGAVLELLSSSGSFLPCGDAVLDALLFSVVTRVLGLNYDL